MKTNNKIIVGAILAAVFTLWWVVDATPASLEKVEAPRAITIISCRIEEFVTIILPDGSEKTISINDYKDGDQIVPPEVRNYHNYEWKISHGEMECMREIVELTDTEELKGAPPLGADFSSPVPCIAAAMSFTPVWNDLHKGWAVFAVGCPNPLYDDNGTPDDKSDDRIIGYKMPECPSEINNLPVKCHFDESEV